LLGDGQLSVLWLFVPCLLLRAVNALLLRTFFNPDEYWQSLEVAHHAVFG
jgi:GPI mannosyltransferase 3